MSLLDDFLRGGLPEVLDWHEASTPGRNPFVEKVAPTPDPEDRAASAKVTPQPIYEKPIFWIGTGLAVATVIGLVIATR